MVSARTPGVEGSGAMRSWEPAGSNGLGGGSEQALGRQIRHELDDLRRRFGDAEHRCRTQIERGSPGAAARAMAEQESIVAELETRVLELVAAAAVAREAERVVGSVGGRGTPGVEVDRATRS